MAFEPSEEGAFAVDRETGARVSLGSTADNGVFVIRVRGLPDGDFNLTVEGGPRDPAGGRIDLFLMPSNVDFVLAMHRRTDRAANNAFLAWIVEGLSVYFRRWDSCFRLCWFHLPGYRPRLFDPAGVRGIGPPPRRAAR